MTVLMSVGQTVTSQADSQPANAIASTSETIRIASSSHHSKPVSTPATRTSSQAPGNHHQAQPRRAQPVASVPKPRPVRREATSDPAQIASIENTARLPTRTG